MARRPKGRDAGGEAEDGLMANWPATTVSLWPIDKIIPYDKNPRTHPQAQLDLLAKSMKDDGVTMPILCDEVGIIIAGHGRRLAALQNGFTEYPVVVARGWSEEKKRAARLKDNSIGLLSGWDIELIKLEISALKLEGYDVMTLGFPELQLRSFGVSVGAINPDVDPEAAPEPPKVPVSERGDVWLLGDHRLVCGDATSKSDVATCLAGAKPHLMVTDPPYGVEYDADWRNQVDRVNGKPYGASAVGKVANDDRHDWREAWQLFPGDVFYCWHAVRHASAVDESLQAAGFEIAWQIIWAKPRFVLSRGDYHGQHEPCWYAVRKGSGHHWEGGRSQSTLWAIDHMKSETGHSTQKPIECMKRPIENNSRVGDCVYEPFAGSGTTIIAGEMTARKVLAIEIDPAYVDVCVQRWQTFAKGEATLEGTNHTFEEVRLQRAKGVKQKRKGRSATAQAAE
jgi:DNA modification methylase